MRTIYAFIMMLFLTACVTKPQAKADLPENLLQKCVPLLPVKGYDGATAQAWMTMAALAYNTCAGRQGRLVDAVRVLNPRNISGEKATGTVKSSE